MTGNKRKTLITCLLAALAFACLLAGTFTAAFARTPTIDGSNFFYANSGASVRAYRIDSANAYTLFHMGDEDDNVTYRYNLAYNWYEAVEDEEGNVESYDTGSEAWFNMEIGFSDESDFDRVVVQFQSQQYSKTKDGVTTNYVAFVMAEDGESVYVVITDDEDMTERSAENLAADGYTAISLKNEDGYAARLRIGFTGYDAGTYSVKVSGELDPENEAVYGEFTNIGGTYSKRVNSSTNGVMPLTFTASFGDSAQGWCDLVLYSLNGQSFKLANNSNVYQHEDGYYMSSDNKVTDDCPPVLCVSRDFSYLEYGEELDFEYTVIDVLASSPKSTVTYYVLTGEQYAAEGYSYSQPEDTAEGDDPQESPFVNSSSDSRLVVETDDLFLTDEILESNATAYDDDGCGYTVGCLVKVCVLLTDVTSSSGNNATCYVMLDWYVQDGFLATIHEGEENESGFIMAVTDERGVTYGYFGEDGEYSLYDERKAAEYQDAVDETALTENGEVALTAGSSEYFYLPSCEAFFSDNLCGYESLTFSIYYTVNGTTGSETGLDYDQLCIPLDDYGTYRFCIYVTDRSSNAMYYLDEKESDDGAVTYELTEFSGSDVYDDEVRDKIPWFRFKVEYMSITVEDPGEQATGYVGTEYNSISFDINGISGCYETAYVLYRFDADKYYAETGVAFSYSEFVENVADIYADSFGRSCFTTIKEYSSLNENDEDYDDFCDYEWSSSSLSFVPQDDNTFYVVKLTVTDTVKHLGDVVSYMAIPVSAAPDALKGESDWLANNVASVVLFSISGVALIGIILLLVIRPKDSGDIDEQMAAEAEKRKARLERKAERKARKG